MARQGQVFTLKTRRADGKAMWAYRYRVDGRGSARLQLGGFASQGDALEGLQLALERQQRRDGRQAQMTLSELAEEYLAQHEAAPRTRSCAGSWRRQRARSATAASSSCTPMRSAPGAQCSPTGIASRRRRRYGRC